MSLAHGTLGADANDPPRRERPLPRTSLVRPATSYLLLGAVMASLACGDCKLAWQVQLNKHFKLIIITLSLKFAFFMLF